MSEAPGQHQRLSTGIQVPCSTPVCWTQTLPPEPAKHHLHLSPGLSLFLGWVQSHELLSHVHYGGSDGPPATLTTPTGFKHTHKVKCNKEGKGTIIYLTVTTTEEDIIIPISQKRIRGSRRCSNLFKAAQFSDMLPHLLLQYINVYYNFHRQRNVIIFYSLIHCFKKYSLNTITSQVSQRL